MIPRPRPIRFYRSPGQRRIGSALDKEWRKSGAEDELWGQIETWEETGFLPPSWHHAEPGTSVEAMGPPRTTVRAYYAEHAGQIILLRIESGKSGKGKLQAKTKVVVEQRLAQWKEWFPKGAELNDDDELVARR